MADVIKVKWSVIFFLVVIFFANSAIAQFATASFNKYHLATNPASVATRDHSFFSASYSQENSQSKIKQERTDGDNFNFKEKVAIEKKEIILAGVGKKIAAELYLAFNGLDKTTELSGNSGNLNKHFNFENNLVNFSYQFSHRLFFGLKFFKPNINYSSEEKFSYPDSGSTTQKTKKLDKYLGLGAGVTLKLTKSLYLGMFYTKTKISSKGNGSYIDFAGNEYKYDNNGSTFEFKTKGVGLSYRLGDTNKKAMRFEIAYQTQDFPFDFNYSNDTTKKNDPRQFYGGLEIAYIKVVFGANVRLTNGPFRDSLSIVRDSVEDPVIDKRYYPTYEYFFSFVSTKGHGFGVSGSYKAGKGKKRFFGQEQQANMINSSYSLTYSYTF